MIDISLLPKLTPKTHKTLYNEKASFTMKYKPDNIIKINTEIYPSNKYREGVYNIYYQYLLLNKNDKDEYEIDDIGIIKAEPVLDLDYLQHCWNKESKLKSLQEQYKVITEEAFIEKIRKMNGTKVVVNNRMSLNDIYIITLLTQQVHIDDIATCFAAPPTIHGFMDEIYTEGPHHSIELFSIEIQLHGTTMTEFDVRFNNFYYKGIFIEGEGIVPMKLISKGNIDKDVKNIILNSLHVKPYKKENGLLIYLFIWNEEISNITSVQVTFSNIYDTTFISNIAYISEELLKMANVRKLNRISYREFETTLRDRIRRRNKIYSDDENDQRWNWTRKNRIENMDLN